MIQTVLVPVAPKLTAKGENLPITGISAKGKIHPVLATIELTQTFVNGDELADVTYHAPIHPDWAVRAVTMTCDDRTIRTIVLPEQKAQETFDAAKEEGHTAILAKEFTPDEMQLQLANVPANAKVTVTSEVVAWPTVEKNRGTILIPLVNGPRYGGSEAQQSFFDPDDVDGRKAIIRLDLELNVENASVDVGTIENERIACEIAPVGQITVEFDAKPTALYHEDELGKYLVVGVPAVRPENAPDWGRTAMLVDRSGSMSGIGIHSAVDVARAVQDRIGENITDAFMFDSTCEHVWPESKVKGMTAADVIASHGTPGGSTKMRIALNRVHKMLEGKIDNIIMVTDALVHDDQISKVAKEISDKGIAVHVVLVSTAPSRYVAEAISTAGGGFFMDLSGGTLERDRIEDGISRFLLGGANLDSVIVDGRRIDCHLPVRGRPLMIPVEVEDRPNLISVVLDGTPIEVPIKDRPEAEFIWAREVVMGIVRDSLAKGDMHFNTSREAIEKVGVDHQILTPFTSFVGFDASESFDRSSVKEIVAQMSLPQGIDAGGFHGLPKGGTLGLSGGQSVMMTQTFAFNAVAPPSFYSPYHGPGVRGLKAGNFSMNARIGSRSMLRSISTEGTESVVAQSLSTPTGSWGGGGTQSGLYSMTVNEQTLNDVRGGWDNDVQEHLLHDARPESSVQFEMTIDNRGDDPDGDGFLYVRARSIDSDAVNENGDMFPLSEFYLHESDAEECYQPYWLPGVSVEDEAAALLAVIAQSLEDGTDPFEGTLLAEFGRGAIVVAAGILRGLPNTPGLESIIRKLAKLAIDAPDATTANVRSGAYDAHDQAGRLAEVA
jgi:hypothetical protein